MEVSTAVKKASGPIWISSAPSAIIVAADAASSGTSAESRGAYCLSRLTMRSAARPEPPALLMNKPRGSFLVKALRQWSYMTITSS
jgi:hypothetical protein